MLDCPFKTTIQKSHFFAIYIYIIHISVCYTYFLIHPRDINLRVYVFCSLRCLSYSIPFQLLSCLYSPCPAAILSILQLFQNFPVPSFLLCFLPSLPAFAFTFFRFHLLSFLSSISYYCYLLFFKTYP